MTTTIAVEAFDPASPVFAARFGFATNRLSGIDCTAAACAVSGYRATCRRSPDGVDEALGQARHIEDVTTLC
jgi:hypothetical protein